eukprot:TRINITY_DN22579_c0_g2_i1.p1 TRINITY_DN22579_c0_g2~~TRINITY_DN22579_c0_g2_i1.p1  ORF type:complete len:292 (-),score=21.24 TRINITY_DN22579_c0_g2_i1:100-975(-)
MFWWYWQLNRTWVPYSHDEVQRIESAYLGGAKEVAVCASHSIVFAFPCRAGPPRPQQLHNDNHSRCREVARLHTPADSDFHPPSCTLRAISFKALTLMDLYSGRASRLLPEEKLGQSTDAIYQEQSMIRSVKEYLEGDEWLISVVASGEDSNFFCQGPVLLAQPAQNFSPASLRRKEPPHLAFAPPVQHRQHSYPRPVPPAQPRLGKVECGDILVAVNTATMRETESLDSLKLFDLPGDMGIKVRVLGIGTADKRRMRVEILPYQQHAGVCGWVSTCGSLSGILLFHHQTD